MIIAKEVNKNIILYVGDFKNNFLDFKDCFVLKKTMVVMCGELFAEAVEYSIGVGKLRNKLILAK